MEGLPFIFADSPTHSPWAGPQGSRLLSLAPAQWRQVTAKQLPVLQASGAGTSSTPASPSPVPLRDPLTSSISAAGFCAHPSLPPFLPFPLSSLLSSSPFSLPLSVNTLSLQSGALLPTDRLLSDRLISVYTPAAPVITQRLPGEEAAQSRVLVPQTRGARQRCPRGQAYSREGKQVLTGLSGGGRSGH